MNRMLAVSTTVAIGFRRWRSGGARLLGRLTAATSVATTAAAFLIVFALAPSPVTSASSGPRLVLEDGSPAPLAYERLIANAEVPTPRQDIVMVFRGCPGAESRSCVPWGQASIYLAEGDENARIFYHELGHVFDQRLPQRVRDRFLRISGDDRPWLTKRNSPLEQFAEAYSLCAINPDRPLHGGIVGYGYRPTVHQHRRVCRLIRRAGQDTSAQIWMPPEERRRPRISRAF